MVSKLNLDEFLQARHQSAAASKKLSSSILSAKSLQARCISARTSSSGGNHKYSRRPMLNKLMHAIANDTSTNNIRFKFRNLGVDAGANQYAFAQDCYSQMTTSPRRNIRRGDLLLNSAQTRPESANQISTSGIRIKSRRNKTATQSKEKNTKPK